MTTPNIGDIVTIDYILKRGDGAVVGNTADVGPQRITLGSEQIFPAIEEALTSMELGDQRSVSIPCAEGFGPRREELVIDLPRANLPPEPAPQPGMVINAQQPDGQPLMMIILEVGEDSVKVDGNHPLSGEDVTFELTLRAIQPAG